MKVAFFTQSSASLLRGVKLPRAIPPLAARLGYEAVALADHNTLSGAPSFLESCRQVGVHGIVGVELTDRAGKGALLLVENQQGYEQVSLLVTERHCTPDWSLAAACAALGPGVIVLVGDRELGETLACRLPPEQLGIVLLRPARSITEERERIETARKAGLRCVAGSRCVYFDALDRQVGRVLYAIRRGELLSRTKVPSGISFLRPPEAMARLFSDLPGALRATAALARRCCFSWKRTSMVVPRPPFPLPEEPNRLLRRLTRRSLRKKMRRPTRRAWERLHAELTEIEHLGLAPYFLVVWDIVCAARSAGILCMGRGSGAGSLVCYALGITPIDPLHTGLLFERFLNRVRPDLPDLDIDVDWRRRDEVIDSVYRRYGSDRVAMIASYVTYRERLAFREVARAWGLPPQEVHRLSAGIPYSPRGGTLREALRCSPRARDIPWDRPPLAEIVTLAERLLALPRHLSVHPAGIVIGDRPLASLVPLTYAPKGVVVTQFDMYALEETGLIKIDILGNRALGELLCAREMIARRHGIVLDLEKVSLSDPSVGELIRSGNTVGCFQIESPAMRHLLIALQSATWEEVCVAVALVRPGPSAAGAKTELLNRKHGAVSPSKEDPLYSILSKALARTCGVFLFDEDIMRVFHAVTGRPPEEGELLRLQLKEARGDPQRVAALREQFLRAAQAAGCEPEAAGAVFDAFLRFAGYTYNQAHAAVFSRIAWYLAFVKAHFPVEFFCAVLNNHGGMYPVPILLAEAMREGIEIRHPCVNRSEEQFSVQEGALRMPLTVVRNLSRRTWERIREGRPFSSLSDFLRCVRPPVREAVNLIHAGAFDFTGLDRLKLLWEVAVWKADTSQEAVVREGFPRLRVYPFLPLLSHRARVARELSVLPFSPGVHPVALLREDFPSGVIPASCLKDHIGERVEVAGLGAAFREVPCGRGERMAFVSLQDETGWTDIVFFPGTYRKVASVMGHMGPYIARGIVRNRYGVIHLEGQDLYGCA